MRFGFNYTGIRVRDIDGAVDFFTKVLGMKLESRVKAPWHKGEFANLTSRDGKPWLEINWYADDSPVVGPFREADIFRMLQKSPKKRQASRKRR